MADLLVIVPSRGRPESVARLVEAWQATGAYDDGAELMFAVDADDPTYPAYMAEIGRCRPGALGTFTAREWVPMVHKLNAAVVDVLAAVPGLPALGFAGDDHLPRTPGWARRYLDEMRQMGTGIVYGDDRIQGARLPTQWATTSDIVRTLGRMVPADVEHLYCDDAIADLGRAARCLRYLPDVVIEHVHPLAGRAAWDDQYRRVNHPGQYARDRAAYERWRVERMPDDVAAVKALSERSGCGDQNFHGSPVGSG
ncbi:hypothetical protein ABZ738_05515 [Micromonospora sp. NPDC047793]|uniref:hypothetical protein n=1 Tax=Micromonospora sp. NPDC047793 TaxID=3154342 RepID=UPI0033D87002